MFRPDLSWTTRHLRHSPKQTGGQFLHVAPPRV
jgi:hypothetical protein